MRNIVLVFLILVPSKLPAQDQSDTVALEARVRSLEQEVAKLKNELRRLDGVESRLRALELVLGSVSDGSLPGAGRKTDPASLEREPLPTMPYGDEQTFAVAAVRREGRQTPAGTERHLLEIDLVEIPVDAGGAMIRVDVEGYRHLGFPRGFPEGSRRYLVVLEDLDLISADAWHDALKPTRGQQSSQEIPLYKQIRIERVATSQTHLKGYNGNSGTVRAFRGQLTWYENNIIFLDDGVLRLVGPAAARFHVGFVKS